MTASNIRDFPASARTVCCLVLLTLGTVPADAQICGGRASFNLAPSHFELDAGTNRRGQGIGLSVGHGTDALFGVLSGARHTLTGAGSVHLFAATLATDQPLSPDNKLHVCPMISLGYVSGAPGAADGGRVGASVAADAAMLAVNTPRMKLIPTISIDLLFNGVGRTTALFAQDASHDYNTFSAGLGFVFSNRVSVVPRVVVPFRSVRNGAFHMTVGYNVLRR